jgi:aldose 1-epimerase
MTCEQKPFGALPDGRRAELFVLRNSNGLSASVTNYGTIITEVLVPDRHGQLGDVVLGFDNLAQYLQPHPYFGCTVGRYANRIAGGRFTLDGQEYRLAVNNGPNSLHGGLVGFDKKIWQAALHDGGVRFSYASPHLEEGYPGTLKVAVAMALNDENELRIDYTATTDQPTVLNLTNHSYFNLAGSGTVADHVLELNAEAYTPVDATSIPTGTIVPVRGTAMDFTTPHRVGQRFSLIGNDPPGYDHNFVINGGGGALAFTARVTDPASGRVLEAWTTEPGVQLYTSNYMDGTLTGKRGWCYQQHAGLCLETQHFPDSPNHSDFPSTVLRPGQTYRQTTVYRFPKL